VPTYVALLRGINVGGRAKVGMAALRAVFESLGYENVSTYIQSGNVVFDAPSRSASRVAVDVEHAVKRGTGVDAAVVIRTPTELAKVVAGNPFAEVRGAQPKQMHVGFLAARVPATAVKQLDPDRSPPDEFAVRGREIYLRCPNGIGRSKLTNDWFESKLRTRVTMRNWATVTKLLSMAESQRKAS
jgi:uncharacterized protein (DUF1697 family)